MKPTKESLLKGLKDYIKEWEQFLDNTFDECDYRLYYETIKKEYNKVLMKLPKEYKDTFQNELSGVIKDVLLKIKEKQIELESFKDNVNIKEILAEDTSIVQERRKKQFLDDIKETLYCPQLMDLVNVKNLDPSKRFKYVNNAMYYRKEFTKKLLEYNEKLKRVDIQLDSEFVQRACVILAHISFLMVSSETSSVVDFVMDNLELYIAHDKYLNNIYTKLKELLE